MNSYHHRERKRRALPEVTLDRPETADNRAEIRLISLRNDRLRVIDATTVDDFCCFYGHTPAALGRLNDVGTGNISKVRHDLLRSRSNIAPWILS